jgi:hypothetical protein
MDLMKQKRELLEAQRRVAGTGMQSPQNEFQDRAASLRHNEAMQRRELVALFEIYSREVDPELPSWRRNDYVRLAQDLDSVSGFITMLRRAIATKSKLRDDLDDALALIGGMR